MNRYGWLLRSLFWSLFLLMALFLLAEQGDAQLNYALLPTPHIQFLNRNGEPLAGGKVYTYLAGTTTQAASYKDSSGSALNTNPVILDSGGFADIWLAAGAYKIRLTDAAGVQLWSVDNVQLTSGSSLPCSSLPTLSGDVSNALCVITIADNAVTSAKINGGAVVAGKLGTGAVTTGTVAAGVIGTAELADSAVTAAKLAADSVITAKILDANVTAGKLAADSVTTAKILDANVTLAKIAAAALSGDGTKLCTVTGALTSGHLIVADATGNCVDGGATPRLTQGATVTGCTVNSGSYSTCSVTLTWPVTFVDTNYKVSCIGVTPVDGAATINGISSRSATQVTVLVATQAGHLSGFATVECVGVHD